MAEPEHIVKLRAAYQRWNDTRGQSVAEWLALMDDGVKLRSAADGAPGMEFSAPRDGKAAAKGYFSALHTDWEMIHYTVEEFLADPDGNWVVVFSRCAFRHRRTGKTADTHVVNRWKFRNGLATDYFELFDTAKAFAAATP